MKSEDVPAFLIEEFNRGYVPADEPPGLEELAYQRWVADGRPVAMVQGSDSIHCPANGNKLLEIVEDKPRVNVVPAQGTPLPLCPTNIDHRTIRGKALLLRAGSPATIVIPESGELRMVAHAYLIMPDSQTDDKTGEVREFARCVFFDNKGGHFRTTAAHGPYRLKAMCDLFDQPQWEAGIPLVITVRKSKRGTTYHDIQIDMEAIG